MTTVTPTNSPTDYQIYTGNAALENSYDSSVHQSFGNRNGPGATFYDPVAGNTLSVRTDRPTPTVPRYDSYFPQEYSYSTGSATDWQGTSETPHSRLQASFQDMFHFDYTLQRDEDGGRTISSNLQSATDRAVDFDSEYFSFERSFGNSSYRNSTVSFG